MTTAETAPELDAQYRLLREEAGVVRAPGLAAISIRGVDAADYLHGQVTNDILALGDGEGAYAALLDRKGRMQADLRVLRIDEAELVLLTESATVPVLVRHLDTYRIGRKVELVDRSEELGVLTVLGPATAEATGLVGGPEHAHRDVAVGPVNVRAVATPGGADLICAAEDSEALLVALAAAGVQEVRPEAAEIIRIESGRPRFGLDMDSRTIPQEAGINDRAVSFTKGCYIGQETVARLHYKGKPNRHLRGLRLSAGAETGEKLHLGEREVGQIGSTALSPALGPIALALVRREAEPGATLKLGEDGRSAQVAGLPLRSDEG